MMMKNSQWMRDFWAEAQAAFKDITRMDEVRLSFLVRSSLSD